MEELESSNSITTLQENISLLSPEQRRTLGTVCLSAVLGTNFVGVNDAQYPVTPEFLTTEVSLENLHFNLNKPYSKAKCLPHLVMARLSIVDNLDSITGIDRLLAFRILLAWQRLLEEPSAQLKMLMDKAVSGSELWEISATERACFNLERSSAHLIFYEYEQCEKTLQLALDQCGLKLDLVGKMGKRTQFQQKTLAQLVLQATSSIETTKSDDSSDIPPDCMMNDDTLLEKIHLENEGSSTVSRLNSVQLACVVACCRLQKRSEYNDVLLAEKCDAYLAEVVGQRRGFAVQCAALLLRSDIEKVRQRKVERACSQTEAIVKLMMSVEDPVSEVKKKERVAFVLACGLETVWEARRLHAQILLSLGCTSEALLIFEQLEMWENVIECYKHLDQLDKGESLIRRLLETRPDDSNLYVYLGDITRETKYYDKAIEISGDRNARARKALGNLMLVRHHYDKAYEHLRRSLELQPIQLGVWFNAGHCAWKQENWSDATVCYHRCVSLEPEHFEAWNNLSAAYIRQGQKERARRILQEALKFNYEHANVWENYLLLCVDTGELSLAVQSYHRLLDLNKQQKDDEVLEILAQEVCRRIREPLDEDDKTESVQLKEQIVKLLARVSSLQSMGSKVWRAYAALKKPDDENDVVEWDRYLQLLERSQLADSNIPNWNRSVENCQSVLESACLLSEERLRGAQNRGSDDAIKQAKSRVRMSLRTLLATANKAEFPSDVPVELLDNLDMAKERTKRLLDMVS